MEILNEKGKVEVYIEVGGGGGGGGGGVSELMALSAY